MTVAEDPDANSVRRRGRWWLLLAAVFAGLYAVNVTVRLLQVKQGNSIWHLGDVGEFLLVLVAMAFFVAGVLAGENVEKQADSVAQPQRR